MLKSIYIKNFILIDTLSLELLPGLIMITGETGAGKSIILGAIEIALGARAEQDLIKAERDEAEIILSFEIGQDTQAMRYLKEQSLDEEDTCIIRRVITRQGKTKNFINGRPCNLSSLQNLGALLVTLHAQHENQGLFTPTGQGYLLDAYADCQQLLTSIAQYVNRIKKLNQTIEELTELSGTNHDRLDYLSYQQKELSEAEVRHEEISALISQHKSQTDQRTLLECYEQLMQVFTHHESIDLLDQLRRLQSIVTTAEKISKNHQLSDLLSSAIISLKELQSQTQSFIDQIDSDVEKLQKIEERLSFLHQLARKHRTHLEELPAFLESIEKEMAVLSKNEETIKELVQEKKELETMYQTTAEKLSKKRLKVAKELSEKITHSIHRLGMPNAMFNIAFNKRCQHGLAIHSHGEETVEFLLTANTGQTASPLRKAASGGEAARIALALQVTLAKHIDIPTLVLDEIDAGVSSKIAAQIGEQLKLLSQSHQVICITHQAHIAALASQHLCVEKHSKKTSTTLTVSVLKDKEHVEEIARMLGGNINEESLVHAKSLLNRE